MKPIAWIVVSSNELFTLAYARYYDFERPYETDTEACCRANSTDKALYALSLSVRKDFPKNLKVYCTRSRYALVKKYFIREDIHMIDDMGGNYISNYLRLCNRVEDTALRYRVAVVQNCIRQYMR